MFWYDEELSKVNLENDWMKLLLKKHNIEYE